MTRLLLLIKHEGTTVEYQQTLMFVGGMVQCLLSKDGVLRYFTLDNRQVGERNRLLLLKEKLNDCENKKKSSL